VAVDEHVFKEHEINENTINDVQSAEINVSNSVELSQMTTPKNLKVSQKKRTPGSSKFDGNEDRTQDVFKMRNP